MGGSSLESVGMSGLALSGHDEGHRRCHALVVRRGPLAWTPALPGRFAHARGSRRFQFASPHIHLTNVRCALLVFSPVLA
jgi:hypothetical protein